MYKIIRFFVERSFQVNLISVAIIVLGLYSIGSMVRQVLPFTERSVIVINTFFPNATPQMIEREVTFPLEETLMGLPGVQSVSSSSKAQQSAIKINWDSEKEQAATMLETIKSRVDAMRWKLPSDIERMEIKHQSDKKSAAMVIALTGFDLNNPTHYQWLDYIKRSLVSVPSVVDVESRETKKNLYIEFQTGQVAFHGLSNAEVVKEVMDTLKQVSIGNVKHNGKNIIIDMEKDVKSVAEIEDITLSANESTGEVRLKDVANVYYKTPKDTFLQPINGKGSIFIRIYQDINADAITVVDNLDAALLTMKAALPQPIELNVVDRATDFLNQQFIVLINNAVMGLVLVLAVMIFFLGVRTAISTSLGIVIAYMGTFSVLAWLGIPFDLISVMAMIVIVGILVDDSIVLSEAYSTDKQNNPGQLGNDTAVNAAKRLMVPVTGGLLTTMVAFLPILFSQSQSSQMFYAIPVVVIVALLISWVECFFILPNHLVHMSSGVKTRSVHLFGQLAKYYSRLLRGLMKARLWLLPLIIIVFGALYSFLQEKTRLDFNLNLGVTRVQITTVLKNAKSVEDSLAQVKPVQDYLVSLKQQFDINVVTQPGKARLGGINKQGDRYVQFSIFIKILKGNFKQVVGSLKSELKDNLGKYNTGQFEVLELTSGGRGGEGNDAINVFIQGKDRVSIDGIKTQLETALTSVDGMRGIYFDNDRSSETWTFIPDYRMMKQYNISEAEFLAQVTPAFTPRKLGFTRFEGNHVDIYSDYAVTEDKVFDRLQALTVLTRDNLTLPTSVFGQWQLGTSLSNITHKNGLRSYKVSVRFDQQTTDLGKFKAAVKQALLPLSQQNPDYLISTESANTALDDTQNWAMKMALFCIIGVVLIIAFTLDSFAKVILSLLPIPFGLIFVVGIFYQFGYHLDVIAMVGMLGVVGISVNNAIIMVHAISQLGEQTTEAVIAGATSRIRAVALTTLTTLVGIFPMAYGIGGESGYTKSIALSLGWGLVGSTLATLFILPLLVAVYFEIAGFVSKRRVKIGSDHV